jgi:SHO1 osmosensor
LADDPEDLSFSRGEILDILNKDEDWWVASKADGSTGSECVFSSFRLAAFC